MFIIRTLNSISEKGTALLSSQKYRIDDQAPTPHGIVLRSALLQNTDINANLLAIARAGVGVNNIPLEHCTQEGVVVFNTPGANANSVKELVINGMLLSSRKILEGINWVHSLSNTAQTESIEEQVEKGKKNFVGPEIKGKNLAIIGLGSIGAIVANAAVELGMRVLGYDPFITIDSAWGLNSHITRVDNLEDAIANSDFVSLHIPLNNETKNLVNSNIISKMKTGVRILNFARGGLVNDDDIITALANGKVARYVTDFPNKNLVSAKNAICTPHLGASTPEAEENSAIMACGQISEFLQTGNIINSANFPTLRLRSSASTRLVILNRNIPTMVGKITNILAQEKINISDMINKHRNDVAVTLIDLDGSISEQSIRMLEDITGIIRVRIISKD